MHVYWKIYENNGYYGQEEYQFYVSLYKTKWMGEKTKELDTSGFKLWYTDKTRSRNGMRIIVWVKEIYYESKKIRRSYHSPDVMP